MPFFRYFLLMNLVFTVLTLGYGLLLRRVGWLAGKRVLLWLIIGVAGGLPLSNLPEIQPGSIQISGYQMGSAIVGPLSHRVATLFTRPFPPGQWFRHRSIAPVVRSTARSSQLFHLWVTTGPTDNEPLLRWLYFSGVLVMALRLGVQLLALRRLIRRSERQSADGVRFRHNSSVRAPFSFFRYIVLDAKRYTPGQLQQILRHESLHRQYGHSIDRLASEMLQIALWLNPLVWWYARLVEENSEYQVDRAVLRAGVNARAYQYDLLMVNFLTQPVGLTNAFSRLRLTRRIQLMNRRPSIGAGLLRLTLFSLLVGGLLLGWPVTQHALIDIPLSRFAVARGDQTYFVIVPTADSSDLCAIQATARHRHITVELAPVVLRDSRHRIRQISFGVRPADPGHSQWTSLKAGTPYGDRPISPLGIRCDPTACTVTPVDGTFPRSLRELARPESGSQPVSRSAKGVDRVSAANVQYGLYETYFLDDMIEGSFYGLRAMLVRIRPDKHLDTYEEAKNAIIIWDKHEISRADLNRIRVTEVMKLSVYKGDAAVARLGDERARPGLIILSKHPNPRQAEEYANSRHLY